jgi:hypothetical protein
MSVIRPKLPADPIGYDPAAAFAAGTVSRQAVEGLAGRLDAARSEVLESAFVDLPDRLLADYGTKRPESELYAMLRTARRIRDAVDRVVVLGGGADIMGVRAVFEACCHPFHNELSRGERGGRPRLSFEGFRFDNDSAQGLLDLVAPHGRPRGDDLLDRWAMVVVDAGGDAPEVAVTTRLFLAALLEAVGGDVPRLAEVVVPITGRTGANTWWQVRFGATSGWVSNQFVTLYGNCSGVIVPPIPPTPTVPGAATATTPPSATPQPSATPLPSGAKSASVVPKMGALPPPNTSLER